MYILQLNRYNIYTYIIYYYLIRVLDSLEIGACLLTDGKEVAGDTSNGDIKGLSSSSRCEVVADEGGGGSVPDVQRKLFAVVHIE